MEWPVRPQGRWGRPHDAARFGQLHQVSSRIQGPGLPFAAAAKKETRLVIVVLLHCGCGIREFSLELADSLQSLPRKLLLLGTAMYDPALRAVFSVPRLTCESIANFFRRLSRLVDGSSRST